MTIKNKVSQLVKKHDTSNPFELARALSIGIIFEPLGDSFGYFSRFNRTSIIHINESLPHKKQVTTCAHELGHVILHPEKNVAFLKSGTFFSTSKIETEANEFMVELLFSQGRDITFCEAVEQYGIPEQLLIKKFTHLKNTHSP